MRDSFKLRRDFVVDSLNSIQVVLWILRGNGHKLEACKITDFAWHNQSLAVLKIHKGALLVGGRIKSALEQLADGFNGPGVAEARE